MADPVVAVFGGTSLLGKEIVDSIKDTLSGVNVQLIASADDESGKLIETGGEPVLVTPFDATALERAAAIVLAAPTVQPLDRHVPIIDVCGSMEDLPSARLRAPLLEPHNFAVPPDAIQVLAHPAAIALALVLSRAHQVFPIRRSVAHVFEPASERGTAGIDEMQQQTVSLLSFKPLPKKVFDTQVSYAMVARFGEEAAVSLGELEARIERHLATLLSISGGAPVPSLRLIQAPVFHGYSFSLWIEFENNPGIAALEQVLNEPPIDVRGKDLEPPNNVGMAGQEGVAVGAMEMDRNQPQAVWLWMAADNLRLAAANAVLVLREVI